MFRQKNILVLLSVFLTVYGTPLDMNTRRKSLGRMEETLKQTSETGISTSNITSSERCNLDKKAKDEARKSCPPDDDPEECPADQETTETCCKCFRFCCTSGMSYVEPLQIKQMSSSAVVFPEEQVVNAKTTNTTKTTAVSDPINGSTALTESKNVTTTKSLGLGASDPMNASTAMTESKKVTSTKTSALGRSTRSTKSMTNKKTEELEVSKATKATKGTANKDEKDDAKEDGFSESEEKVIQEIVAEADSKKVKVALNKLASALKNATEGKTNKSESNDGDGEMWMKKEAVSCSSLKSSGSISIQPSNMKGVNCTEHNILDEFFPPKSSSASNKSKRTRRGVNAKEQPSKADKNKDLSTPTNAASTTETIKIDDFIPAKSNRSKRGAGAESEEVDDFIPAKKLSTTTTTEASILDQFIPPIMNGSSGTGEATKSGRTKRSPGESATSQLTVLEIDNDNRKDSGGVVAVGKIKNETETRSKSFVTAAIDQGEEIMLSPSTDAYDQGIQKSSNYRESETIYSEHDSFHSPVSSSGSLTETFPTFQINTTTVNNNRVKPGKCQSITGGKQCISLGPDASQCSLDGQCEGSKKCCFYGCAPYNRVGICDLPSFY